MVTSQKNSNPPSSRRRRGGGGGQELKANVKELTNLGTLQVSNFELYVEHIKQLLSCQIQYFKAGSISTCYSRWLDLTSDPEVLSTVKGQPIEFISTPFQERVPPQKIFSAKESTIIQSEINKLLQKEVIVTASNEPGQFISTIFLRPKPDGTHRMILNLKKNLISQLSMNTLKWTHYGR